MRSLSLNYPYSPADYASRKRTRAAGARTALGVELEREMLRCRPSDTELALIPPSLRYHSRNFPRARRDGSWCKTEWFWGRAVACGEELRQGNGPPMHDNTSNSPTNLHVCPHTVTPACAQANARRLCPSPMVGAWSLRWSGDSAQRCKNAESSDYASHAGFWPTLMTMVQLLQLLRQRQVWSSLAWHRR